MADSLVLRGRVLPLTGAKVPDSSSVVVKDGRISAVGDEAPSGARVLDAGDRPVIPGFTDPHAHVEVSSSARYAMVDCRAPTHATVADVLDELRDHVNATAGADGWVVGQANLFFDQKLRDKRLPTRQELDGVCPDRPLALRAGGHTTALNSKAFEQSRVTDYIGRQGMMGGAVVEMDSAGEPTGVISELDAVLGLPELSEQELRVALDEGVRELFIANGVTAIGEISETVAGVEALDSLIAEGLPIRIATYLWAPGTLTIDEVCNWQRHVTLGSGADRMAVRGLKLFADGGYSARNAATRTPYLEPYALEPGSRGQINLSRDAIREAWEKTAAAGLQLAVHANGERAQDEVIAALAGIAPSQSLPVRVEHAGNLLTERSALIGWREAGIVPIPQPVFLYNFGDFFPVYLGDAGKHGRFPFRLLLDQGWRVSGSSDVHLGAEEEQTSPMFSIWCAVARQSYLGEHIEPEQAVSVDEALLMHTLYAAEALGEQDVRGSLEPGKVADLVVLDRDPRSVAADDLRNIKVDYVFADGSLVYERPGAAPLAATTDNVIS